MDGVAEIWCWGVDKITKMYVSLTSNTNTNIEGNFLNMQFQNSKFFNKELK